VLPFNFNVSSTAAAGTLKKPKPRERIVEPFELERVTIFNSRT
jgi:hypothetical protein